MSLGAVSILSTSRETGIGAASSTGVAHLQRRSVGLSLDRAVDLPRSRGPRTTHSGAYVEDENIASGAKTKRGRLNPTDLRCNSHLYFVNAQCACSPNGVLYAVPAPARRR